MIHIKTFSKRLLFFGLAMFLGFTNLPLKSMEICEKPEQEQAYEIKKEAEHKTFLQRTIAAMKRNPGKTALALIGISASIGGGILWLNRKFQEHNTANDLKGLDDFSKMKQKQREMIENLPPFQAPHTKTEKDFNKHVKLGFDRLLGLKISGIYDWRTNSSFKAHAWTKDYWEGKLYYPEQSEKDKETNNVLVYEIISHQGELLKTPTYFTRDQWNQIINLPKPKINMEDVD